MDKLQVLVATMHQSDFSIVKKMNIRCSAVIANQADREEIVNKDTDHGKIKMITTATRGVGLNRNIALMAADSEFVLFADDDVIYNDDMPEKVVAAFNQKPKADVIVFGIYITKKGVVIETRCSKPKRLHLWNAMKYGMVTIAVRREALLRNRITFHECFGGGCRYSYGEDSLFLKACFDCGLKVYAHDYIVGTCGKDSSTCFTGYHKRYFYDKGVLMRYLFPKFSYLMALYFAVRFKRETKVGVMQRIQLMLAGVKNGKKMLPYCENEK